MTPPYSLLYELEMKGIKAPLVYTIGGLRFSMAYTECVDAADSAMILGDAWFRKYLVIHDLLDLEKKRIGLGLLRPTYVVGAVDDSSVTLSQVTFFEPPPFVSGLFRIAYLDLHQATF